MVDEGVQVSFQFRMSLRLRHPAMGPQEISQNLGVHPQVKWAVGEPGRISGIHDHTYWSGRVGSGDSTNFLETLDENLTLLEAHREFILRFMETGGSAEFFVGWFTTDTSGGVTLEWEMMRRLAALRMDVAFDVYGSSVINADHDI